MFSLSILVCAVQNVPFMFVLHLISDSKNIAFFSCLHAYQFNYNGKTNPVMIYDILAPNLIFF